MYFGVFVGFLLFLWVFIGFVFYLFDRNLGVCLVRGCLFYLDVCVCVVNIILLCYNSLMKILDKYDDGLIRNFYKLYIR